MVDANSSNVRAPRGPVAQANTSQHKVLRILVLEGRKVIEDKLLRKPQKVNISCDASKKATINIPSVGVPQHHLLFEPAKGGYTLYFTDKMGGRLSNASGQADLQTLRHHQGVVNRGGIYAIFIDENTKGKVFFGEDAVILFQFVAQPPEPKAEKLNLSIKDTLAHSIDWIFMLLLAGAFLFETGFVYTLYHTPMPPEKSFDEVNERWAALIVPDLKREEKPPEPEQKDGEGPSTKKKEEPQKMEKQDTSKMSESQKEAYTAARKEKARSLVAGKGVLAMIGTAGEGSASGFVADVFGQNAGISEGAFDGITGIGVATGDGERTRRGGSAVGDAASIDKLGTSGGGQVASGTKKETKVSSVVKSEAPEVDGDLDPNAVAKYVKARMTSIKECYERELKRDPKLAGKLTISFTIETDGKISETYVESNTMGNKNVANCITGRIRSWRFPKPKGGSVTVAYPFIFSPST